ncbi:uncharacterized protein K452DRAFT_297332 [Aplosporella prunicola CBS 121167]|uniref:Uncharacterized protein n=1 Tax=Aplosporella prunicola CBS 121167 TaxID=1176127 RepID=A0A6A6BF53_9PEZI|nr:uncharacterized protein K452DRAFT_297332 [Aplosporella prunicola CBS 121167]KAF2142799.1 hypothetical protein K452DRAFT_297332 [Aplosporella prunicola CBS 121167]
MATSIMATDDPSLQSRPRQLSDLIVHYPILTSLAAELTSMELFNLARTSKAAWANIVASSEESLPNLMRLTKCDGRFCGERLPPLDTGNGMGKISISADFVCFNHQEGLHRDPWRCNRDCFTCRGAEARLRHRLRH